MALVNACGGTTTVTGPTVTATKTVTSTVAGPGGATVTTTVTAGGGATVTTTVPGPTVTKTVSPPAGAASNVVTLNVNNEDHTLKVEPEWTLSFVLRKKLGLTGTKVPCDRGECGLCSILADGKLVLACCMPAIECEGIKITTIEGLADGATLHPVQQQYLDNCTFQCGFCTPAMILTTVALYAKYPNPTPLQAREAISGNLCWCGDQTRILGTIMKKQIRAKRGVA